MEQSVKTISHEQQAGLSKYDQLKAVGAVFLASSFLAAGNADEVHAEELPAVPLGNTPALDMQAAQTRGVSQEEYQKDKYCIQQGLYSFSGGWVGYGKPDQKGRFLRVRQHVEADPLPSMCKNRVTREVGVRQVLNGRPNTNYRVVSKSPGEVDKTVNQRGYRAWKCFKRFRQQVFVTVTTDEGYGQSKIYNGRLSKPNC